MARHLWYRNAVVYCLDVETFMDGDGDGCGDFNGLRSRLDYLDGLGINCIWLMPIYPTPNRDNGYDVTDYYGVDPRLGTLGDFVEFVLSAKEHGMRVILDLPVNHTSIEHPWFQRAREDRDSRFHDYYVWKDERPEDGGEVSFPGVQEEAWTYDRSARRYYLHRFYEHQPDLNISNPAVREEIRRIMGFWLELGISGFRLDAAPYLIELKGIEGAEETDPYTYLREFRDFLSWRRGDAILLAEADVSAEQIGAYFGDGDRMHMLFNFLLNQHLFLALARQDSRPLIKAIEMTPPSPEIGQWANFLRNHDELNLARLTDVQREAVFDAFAPDPDMRVYGRGIRRRLAPMLEGDPDRLRMVHSLLLSLPGTPVLRYGEEIGMGDDLSLDERNAVRTAMQWSDGRNGGFSVADPEELPRPAIEEGEYGYREVNVEQQTQDPDSLLAWMERAIRTRKRVDAMAAGTFRILEADDPGVFAHACFDGEAGLMAVHNLSDEDVTVTVDVSGIEGDSLCRVLGPPGRHPIGSTLEIELGGYGFRWFTVE